MNLAQIIKTRHTVKAFDPAKKIPEALVEELRVLLRYSPSSANTQPWHFIIAASDEGKARITRAMLPPYVYNGPKIRNASHVIVLCARKDMDKRHLATLLAQEENDGRYSTPEAKEAYRVSRLLYVDLHQITRKDLPHWLEKQVYLCLGTLLLGAAALGIDACPMEGFDRDVLDRELDLHAQGLTSVAIVALGTASTDDWNARLPKSRLPAEALFTTI